MMKNAGWFRRFISFSQKLSRMSGSKKNGEFSCRVDIPFSATVDGSEILNNHLGLVKTLINNGIIIILMWVIPIIYRVLYILGGFAGFWGPINRISTVSPARSAVHHTHPRHSDVDVFSESWNLWRFFYVGLEGGFFGPCLSRWELGGASGGTKSILESVNMWE